MGLFSAIGGFISSVGSAIIGVCETVGGVLKTAAEGICNFAGNIIEKGKELFPEIEPLRVILDVVGTVVSKIAEFLGIKKEEQDSPEELGLKTEEADKDLSDFESTQEYIDYLHNEVKVDEAKKKSLSPEQRAAYCTIGSSLYLDASAEKLGIEKGDITADVLLDCAKLKMDAEEIVAAINKLKEEGLKPQNMSDYLHNSSEATFEDKKKVGSAMMAAFKEVDPELSDSDIVDKLSEMRQELTPNK